MITANTPIMGVLERISGRENVSLIALEINLKEKEKREQEISVEQIEHDMISIGYNGIRELDKNSGSIYHLYFQRGKPNA